MTHPSPTRSFTLSNVPSFAEQVTLLVGLEESLDGLHVYLGSRAKGLYLVVTDEQEKERFRKAWATGGHVWMWPLPAESAIHSDKAAKA